MVCRCGDEVNEDYGFHIYFVFSSLTPREVTGKVKKIVWQPVRKPIVKRGSPWLVSV